MALEAQGEKPMLFPNFGESLKNSHITSEVGMGR